MKHIPYKLNLDLMTRLIRKSGFVGIGKHDRNESAMRKAISYIYHAKPELMHTLEFMIHCEEHAWLTSDKQVYFFDSADTARALIDSSIKMESIDSLYTEHEKFMVAVPRNLMIGGKRIGSGLMVNIMAHSERAQLLTDGFCKWIGMPSPSVSFDNQDGSTFGIYVSYQEAYGTHEYMRFAYPSNFVAECLKCKTVDEYAAYTDAHNKFSFWQGADLTAPEKAYQFELVRLIAGLLLYRKALPDRIKAGMPSDFKERDFDCLYVSKQQGKVLSSPATEAGQTMSAHYRSWHFRQLMADRFYQGEHASQPKGSRIVFVRDSMVNRETDNEVVT